MLFDIRSYFYSNVSLIYYSIPFCFFFLSISIIFILFVKSYSNNQKLDKLKYYIILLVLLLSLYVLYYSNNLLVSYFIIELQSISFYIKSTNLLKKTSKYSVDNGIKYFVLGSFSSALFLLGNSFIYKVSGMLNLMELKDMLFWVFSKNIFFSFSSNVSVTAFLAVTDTFEEYFFFKKNSYSIKNVGLINNTLIYYDNDSSNPKNPKEDLSGFKYNLTDIDMIYIVRCMIKNSICLDLLKNKFLVKIFSDVLLDVKYILSLILERIIPELLKEKKMNKEDLSNLLHLYNEEVILRTVVQIEASNTNQGFLEQSSLSSLKYNALKGIVIELFSRVRFLESMGIRLFLDNYNPIDSYISQKNVLYEQKKDEQFFIRAKLNAIKENVNQNPPIGIRIALYTGPDSFDFGDADEVDKKVDQLYFEITRGYSYFVTQEEKQKKVESTKAWICELCSLSPNESPKGKVDSRFFSSAVKEELWEDYQHSVLLRILLDRKYKPCVSTIEELDTLFFSILVDDKFMNQLTKGPNPFEYMENPYSLSDLNKISVYLNMKQDYALLFYHYSIYYEGSNFTKFWLEYPQILTLLRKQLFEIKWHFLFIASNIPSFKNDDKALLKVLEMVRDFHLIKVVLFFISNSGPLGCSLGWFSNEQKELIGKTILAELKMSFSDILKAYSFDDSRKFELIKWIIFRNDKSDIARPDFETLKNTVTSKEFIMLSLIIIHCLTNELVISYYSSIYTMIYLFTGSFYLATILSPPIYAILTGNLFRKRK